MAKKKRLLEQKENLTTNVELDESVKIEETQFHQRNLLELQISALKSENVKLEYEVSDLLDANANLKKSVINLEKEVNDLLNKRKEDAVANQEATAKQQEDFGAGWQKAYRQYVENSKNGFNQAGSAFQTLSRGFEDSIVKFVQTGKLSFKDLFNDLIAQAVRAQSNKLLMTLIGSAGGFLSSFFGGGTMAGAAVQGLPAYANGGSIPAGQLSVVGERGPELFLPRSAGTIIPNGGGMGGTVNNTAVTYSIQAVDAQSFKSLLARDPEFIHNVAEQGRRSMPIRSRR